MEVEFILLGLIVLGVNEIIYHLLFLFLGCLKKNLKIRKKKDKCLDCGKDFDTILPYFDRKEIYQNVCFFCGKSTKRIYNNLNTCLYCQQNQVDSSKVKECYTKALNFFKNTINISFDRPQGFQSKLPSIEYDKLIKLDYALSASKQRLCLGKTIFQYTDEGEDKILRLKEISIVKNQPEIVASATLCHELMHIWLEQQYGNECWFKEAAADQKKMIEGLCELMRYLFLRKQKETLDRKKFYFQFVYKLKKSITDLFQEKNSTLGEISDPKDHQWEKCLILYQLYKLENEISTDYGDGFRYVVMLYNNGLSIKDILDLVKKNVAKNSLCCSKCAKCRIQGLKPSNQITLIKIDDYVNKIKQF